jgi:hypothetical protein
VTPRAAFSPPLERGCEGGAMGVGRETSRVLPGAMVGLSGCGPNLLSP